MSITTCEKLFQPKVPYGVQATKPDAFTCSQFDLFELTITHQIDVYITCCITLHCYCFDFALYHSALKISVPSFAYMYFAMHFIKFPACLFQRE